MQLLRALLAERHEKWSSGRRYVAIEEYWDSKQTQDQVFNWRIATTGIQVMIRYAAILIAAILVPTALPAQSQPAHSGDSLALVAFYNGLSAGHPSNWLQGSVSSWQGVSLNDPGRVSRLELPNRGLAGPISSELGQLSNLWKLTLSDNQLTGPLPPEWRQLHWLRELHLDGNRLTGPLPTEWGQLSSLEELTLSDNQLTGPLPPEWRQLHWLRELHLDGNQLTGPLPTEWGQLTGTSRLPFRLNLARNQLSGPLPTEWSQLSRLENLNLSGNQLSGLLPSEWWQLSRLEGLHLDGNQLTGPLPTEWWQLHRLIDLNLSGNQLTGALPPEWGQLPILYNLTLAHNQLAGALPSEWGQLSRLLWLDLSYNQLTGPLPTEWGQFRGTSRIPLRLNLSGNQLSGPLPMEWGQLSNLWRLDLSYNQLTGPLPPEWSQLTSASRSAIQLNLARNQLSGPLPMEWGQLSHLSWLNLSGNQLTGPLPTEWGQLSRLEELYLSGNQLTGLPDLTALNSIDSLSVANNRLNFEDLEPNATLFDYIEQYAPQDSIATLLHGANDDTDIILTVATGGNQNTYQWHMNGDVLAGAVSSELRLSSPTPPADYHATVMNALLPGLTLASRPFAVTSVFDSLALAVVYKATGGTDWQDNTGWLQAPVSQWQGVHLNTANRVSRLDLADQGLAGALPQAASHLSALTLLSLQRNFLDGLPDLSVLPIINAVDVSYNRLTFGALETSGLLNSNVAAFRYAPQDSIALGMRRTASEVIFRVDTPGSQNQYQWYRDGQAIAGADSTELRTGIADPRAVYHVTVTDSRYPDLVLVSRRLASTYTPTAVAPTTYQLLPNYPNPFVGVTLIPFSLAESAHVRLTVLDLLGRTVETLLDAVMSAGHHYVSFDGAALAPSLYYYRIQAGPFQHVQSMTRLH